MPKPRLTIKDVAKFNEIKNSIDEAYKRLDDFKDKLVERYGVGQFEVPNPSGGFYKLTIKDQVTSLTLGETVFKATGISRYLIEIKEVKKSTLSDLNN